MALTPEQISGLRAAAEDIAQPVINWLLKDIAERVELAGEMTSTAAYEVYRAQALGESKRALKNYLKRQLKLSNKEIRRLLRKAVSFASEDDYERVGVWATEADKESLMQLADAAVKVVGKDLRNITKTLGMVSPITGRPQPLHTVYQDCMDVAIKLVSTGGASASEAARQATRKLAERGVVTIDYASGVSTELGAAVRRNLMSGMGLLVEQVTQNNHDALGCNGWEISAHANSAPDHEPIQGKQFSDAEFEQLNSSLARRIGTLNCGHVAMPIIIGVNSPQYTADELSAFQRENAEGVTYEGRHMTGYEATQYQNRIERSIRKQKRRVLLSNTTGDKEQLLTDQVRLTRLNQEYQRFNAAMGFKSRAERLEVIGYKHKAKARSLDFIGKPRMFSDQNGIISIKGYEVKGCDGIFTQTYSLNAQNTVKLIKKEKEKIPELKKVKEILIAKDIPGIAAYDHVDNRLYVNEMISNVEYIKKTFSEGYFVAENAEDTLRHEMHHKEHWDLIEKKTLTSAKDSDTVKQKIEADLKDYVIRQIGSQNSYVSKVVSRNAEIGMQKDSLNELVAEVLLQNDKGNVRDKYLLEKVVAMFHDD